MCTFELNFHQTDEPYSAIQVCFDLNGDNQAREIEGLINALQHFNLSEGVILTLDQTDKILINNYTIQVAPAFSFILS